MFSLGQRQRIVAEVVVWVVAQVVVRIVGKADGNGVGFDSDDRRDIPLRHFVSLGHAKRVVRKVAVSPCPSGSDRVVGETSDYGIGSVAECWWSVSFGWLVLVRWQNERSVAACAVWVAEADPSGAVVG